MLFVAAIFIFPIIGFIAMSFRDADEVAAGQGGFLGLGGVSLTNVAFSWTQVNGFGPGSGGLFTQWMINSRDPGRRRRAARGGRRAAGRLRDGPAALPRSAGSVLFITLLAMVMPNTVLVIPLFLEVSAIGAVGELWPVVVIMGFFPFGTYLAYIHFMTTLPKELVEAARIDGLGEVAIFFRVATPISKQAVALVAFFSFVANWTNFFLPLALLELQPGGQDGLDRAAGADRGQPAVQPDGGRRSEREALHAAAGAGDLHLDAAAADRLPRGAAVPDARPDGGCGEGLSACSTARSRVVVRRQPRRRRWSARLTGGPAASEGNGFARPVHLRRPCNRRRRGSSRR